MLSYVIASYDRPNAIGKKTLKMLMYNNIEIIEISFIMLSYKKPVYIKIRTIAFENKFNPFLVR